MAQDRTVVVRMSADEYARLEYAAEKLELSMAATVRALVPDIPPPSGRTITDPLDVPPAAPDDLVAVRPRGDRDELSRLLKELFQMGAAVTLAKEIERQVLIEGRDALTVRTYKRLSRWCNPNRWTSREKAVRPVAQQISKVLYDRVIDRAD